MSHPEPPEDASMAVISPPDSEYDHAPAKMNYDESHAPYGYAGFLVGDCTVVCPECHDLDEHDTDSPIFGDEEADYPGLWCDGCERPLSTYLLVYESGPGSHLWGELDEHAYL